MPSDQDVKNLNEYLEFGSETASLDFKSSHLFDKPALRELVKDIFAMANTRGGGVIVVGVNEEQDGSFISTGLDPAHLASFKEDELKDLVGGCASSAVEFSARPVELDRKVYLYIQVKEFEEFPVICGCEQTKKVRKNGVEKDEPIFRPGDLFIRSRESRPATRLVQTHLETKELIELAVDKAYGRLRDRGWVLEQADLSAEIAKEGSDLLD